MQIHISRRWQIQLCYKLSHLQAATRTVGQVSGGNVDLDYFWYEEQVAMSTFLKLQVACELPQVQVATHKK